MLHQTLKLTQCISIKPSSYNISNLRNNHNTFRIALAAINVHQIRCPISLWRDNDLRATKNGAIIIAMTKNNLQHELRAILRIVEQTSESVSIREIEKKLDFQLPLRSLQRRLETLVKEKRLIIEGSHRSIRYKLVSDSNADTEIDIPLSPISIKIRQQIRKPLLVRTPVYYNRSFLDTYQPNVTFYLPENIQKHLETIGGTHTIQQPAGTYAKTIMQRVLIDLSWNSSRLEGNTYSLLETERLLLNQENAENKNAAETQMLLNHKAAIEFLVDMAEDIQFNAYTILNLHALLSHNLLTDPMACGRLRAISVSIGKASYHPLEIPALIDECFHQILNKANAIHNPFERAFFVMVHLPYLQPFEDVNKRVARLSANIPLIQHNLSPLSFIDVPERTYIDAILGVYELNQIDLLRDLFVWAYERSAARYSTVRQSLGEPDLFRLRYHALITEVISAIIQEKWDKKNADFFIKKQALLNFTEKDRARFVEVVETEVNALHEGNIARYRIRLGDFQAWHKIWD